MTTKLFALILATSLLACRDSASRSERLVMSDTVRVLDYALRQAIDIRFMPGASHIFGQHDSLLYLTTRSIPIEFLRSWNYTGFFTVVPHQQICNLLSKDSLIDPERAYLEISQFENRDSLIYIQVKNLGCLPFSGGGSLALELKVRPDTLIVVRRSTSSIN